MTGKEQNAIDLGRGGLKNPRRIMRTMVRVTRTLFRVAVFRVPGASLAILVLVGVAVNVSGRATYAGLDNFIAANASEGGSDVDEVVIGDPGAPDAFDVPVDGLALDASPTLSSGADAGIGSDNAALDEDFDAESVLAFPTFETPALVPGGRHSGVAEYVVKDGDTLSTIAESFSVNTSTVLWANNLHNVDLVRPGQVLRIPSASGVLYTVKHGDTLGALVTRFHGTEEQIVAFNGLPADGTLPAGEEILIPNGSIPPPPPVQIAVRATGYSGKRFGNLPVLDGFFAAPTTGRNLGRIHSHNGVDIDNVCGTPLYAAAAGTILRADPTGWNGGYGEMTLIRHGNGTETLYGHQSRIMVAAGQAVAQGELIGLMGTTGRSTGCHLHFEVHGARNPFGTH